MSVEFEPWPKSPRWFRDVTVSEKLDGTNAGVHIVAVTGEAEISGPDSRFFHTNGDGDEFLVVPQSRKRIITPSEDNYGFAKWVEANAWHLISTLGPGLHYGEYWGEGIQRRYDMKRKVFSLFNTAKWGDVLSVDPDDTGLAVVPVLYEGPLRGASIDVILEGLAESGSHAAPGFMRPEGVCIFHHASRNVYKALIDNDDIPKSAALFEARERPFRDILERKRTKYSVAWESVLRLAVTGRI